MLTIQALGPLKIYVDDQMIDERAWRRHSSRQLIQILLSRKKYRISRLEAVELLWPELAPEAASNKLYIAVNGLRNLLEPERSVRGGSNYIETTAGYIELLTHRPNVRLDIIEFENFLDQAEKDLNPYPMLQQAVKLYEGELFTGYPLESFWLQRKNELQHKYAQAVLKLSQHYILQKSWVQAEQILAALMGIEPPHEEAARLLMQVCASRGNRLAALQHYDVLKRHLAELMGVKPDTRTEELVRQIRLREQPLAATTQPDVLVPAERPLALALEADVLQERPTVTLTQEAPELAVTQPIQIAGHYSISSKLLRPMLGRDEMMQNLLEQVSSRATKNICLYGLHGVGKSTLALHLAHRAQSYFSSGAIRVDLSGATTADQMLEKMAVALQLPLAATVIPFLDQAEILLVADHLESVAAAKTLVQITEPFEGVVLLLTCRSAVHDQRSYCHNILVPGLETAPTPELGSASRTPSASIELLMRKLKEFNPAMTLKPEQIGMIAAMVTELDGIPRAIEAAANLALLMPMDELNQQITRLGQLGASVGSDQPDQWADFSRLEQANCDGLSDFAARGLAALSIFSYPFSFKAALSLFDSKEDLLKVLAELVDSGLLIKQINNDVNPYDLTHLARRFGYKKLSENPATEQAVKRRHASYMASQVGRIGLEFSVGEPDAAIMALLNMHHDIVQTLNWAVQHEPAMAVKLCIDLTGFWIARGLHTQGIRYGQDLVNRLQGGALPVDESVWKKILYCLGKLYMVDHNFVEATQQFKNALPYQADLAEEDFQHKIRTELAESLLKSGQYEEAFSHLQLLPEAVCAKNNALAAHIWLCLAEYHWLNGDKRQADSSLDQALEIARWSAPVHLLIRALMKKVQVLNFYNKREHALYLLEEGRKLTGSYGNLNLKPFLNLQQGEIYLAQGQYDLAEQALLEARQSASDIGNKKCLALALLGMTKCAVAKNQLSQALPLLQQTLELTSKNSSLSVKLEAERISLLLNALARRYFDMEKSLKEIRRLWKFLAPLVRQHYIDSILVAGVAVNKSPLVVLLGNSTNLGENPQLQSHVERAIFEAVSPEAVQHLLARKHDQTQKATIAKWYREFNGLLEHLEFESAA
jgi:DNA-binding SARP family transcriptional activator